MYYMIKSGTTALTNNDNLQGAADLLTLYSPAKSLFAQVSRMDRNECVLFVIIIYHYLAVFHYKNVLMLVFDLQTCVS